MKNTDYSSKAIVKTGLCTAIVAVFTLIRLPLSVAGYVNLGDIAIFALPFVLKKVRSNVVAAGLGSVIVDIICGFPMYAPATLIIKGIMGLTASLAINSKNKLLSILLVLSAVIIMPAGYFLYELLVLRYGVIVASGALIFNGLQVVIGAIVGIFLGNLIKGYVK